MTKEFKIKPPMMPNFVIVYVDNTAKVEKHFPITEFTRKEAEEFGELMKKTFIEHWEKKQLKPEKPSK